MMPSPTSQPSIYSSPQSSASWSSALNNLPGAVPTLAPPINPVLVANYSTLIRVRRRNDFAETPPVTPHAVAPSTRAPWYARAAHRLCR